MIFLPTLIPVLGLGTISPASTLLVVVGEVGPQSGVESTEITISRGPSLKLAQTWNYV